MPADHIPRGEFRPNGQDRWDCYRDYYELIAICPHCHHRGSLAPRRIDRTARPDDPISAIEARLHCRHCKRRGGTILAYRLKR